MSDPFKPTGSDFESHFAQRVHEKSFGPEGKLRNTKTMGFDVRHDGIFPRVKRQFGGSSGLQGPFQIDSVQGDYLTCYDYDPVNETRTGTSPVYIAKEDLHQNSLTSATIFGVVHNYTYQDGTNPPANPNGGGTLAAADAGNVFRIDNYGGATAVHRIYPPWEYGADGEIVWAVRANTGVEGPGGALINLQIAGRSCQWGVVNE